MPKLNIKVTVNNDLENIDFISKAIIQDNLLKYKEKDNTTVIYDYEKNSLFRENNELRMEYSFNSAKKTQGSIKIKELNRTVKIDIKTNKLERKNNNIEVEYIIEDKPFLYKIEEIKWVF